MTGTYHYLHLGLPFERLYMDSQRDLVMVNLSKKKKKRWDCDDKNADVSGEMTLSKLGSKGSHRYGTVKRIGEMLEADPKTMSIYPVF